MNDDRQDRPPSIFYRENGPFFLRNHPAAFNSRGEPLRTEAIIAFCRCGESKKKPYCDGTDVVIGFSGARLADGAGDRRADYAGDGITIHDNRSICAHAGHCATGLAAVFSPGSDPWIDPNAAPVDEIVAVIEKCPSGALSYSIDGAEHRDRAADAPEIRIAKNGPLLVTGGIELEGAPWAEGASREHYALCRCGQSKNKPFCDGAHAATGFVDEDN